MTEEENINKIAVIGISCKLPGAKDVKQYWHNLINGVESVKTFSREELIQSGADPAIIDHPDYVKSSPVIDDAEIFDAAFFGYSPEEARFIDPQQRIFLECCWNALEDGGYNPYKYQGKIGVFGGCSMNLYLVNNIAKKFPLTSPQQIFTTMVGNEKDYLTTRVSYQFNLKGPSINVQTACSTSLVAIHLACQNLLNYDCDMALAGGATVKIPRNQGYLFQDGLIYSNDGHCRAFDKNASGTIFGEGAGIVLLKRYEEAIADNDQIYAVILGSAINNDGASKVGFTAPSVNGQKEAIESAYAFAGVDPQSVSYIETHGTGTLLGDPIEIEALADVFKKSEKKHCVLGSVKTNIGHLDAAAGVASFIKTVLILKHGIIPPILHFKEPNPELRLDQTPFYINNSCIEIKKPPQGLLFSKPFRAGVSSFGIGGTNAHILLETFVLNKYEAGEKPAYILPLSAKTLNALNKKISDFLDYLINNPTQNCLNDIAYTLQHGRAHFRERVAPVAESFQDVKSIFEKENLFYDRSQWFSNPEITFMFSGQGSQYINMAKQLYKYEPIFQSNISKCAEIIEKYIDLNIVSVICSEDSENNVEKQQDLLTRTEFAQPTLFTLEYSLAKTLINWGVKPDNFIGHSLGEYVAAALADVFTLEQAIEIVCMRGQLMQNMPSGRMLSVAASAEAMQEYCNEEISLSVINSPEHCVLGGNNEAIALLEKKLNSLEIKTSILKTSHAFHTEMMEPAAKAFVNKLYRFSLNAPKIPFISNVSGAWITSEEAASPVYWGDQIRNTVRFSTGMDTLLSMKKNHIFIEIGPGNTLCSLAMMHKFEKKQTIILPSLPSPKQGGKDYIFLLKTIARLWECGLEINWNELTKKKSGKRCSLPTYPFEGKRYWIDTNHEKEKTSPNNNGSISEIVTNMDNVPGKGNAEIDVYHVISEIWKETLGLNDVKVNDEFYQLGGNSLIASQVLSRLNTLTGKKLITMKELLKNSTLKAQIEIIEGKLKSDRLPQAIQIPVLQHNQYLPISESQERLWFISKLEPENISHNIVQGIQIRGKVNVEYLKKAWSAIVERHEILRSVFLEVDNEVVIRLIDISADQVTEIDLSSETESISKAESHIKACACEPFDLAKGPLFRTTVYRLSNTEYYFIVCIHHIISDGWSMSIWIDELTRLYASYSKCERPQLPSLPFQFADFAAWQKGEESRYFDTHYKEFWIDMLGRTPQVLQLPADNRRPDKPKYRGKLIPFSLSAKQNERVKAIIGSEKSNLFHILLGMFSTLLYRYSNQKQIIVGCPNANRMSHSGLEQLIGFFINMVPYKIVFDETTTFRQLIKQLIDYTDKISSFQDIPFAKLVEIINPPRATNHTPIFQVMFAFQNYPYRVEAIDGLNIERRFFDRGISEYDLSLYLCEENQMISGVFEYSTELFSERTMKTMVDVFSRIIDSITENLDMPVIKIPLVTSHVLESISSMKEKTKTSYDRNRTVIQFFESQVLQSENKVACLFGADSITYGDLNRVANQLGSCLRKKGIGPGLMVGIMLDRSIDMVIAMLAVLKSGGAYVPLDPSFPENRLAFMIEDSGLQVLITQTGLYENMPIPERVVLIVIDKEWSVIKQEQVTNLISVNSGDDPAYAIYTSGSTGTPKGVVIPHQAMTNLIMSMTRKPGFTSSDILLAVTTISFDISVLEIFVPLICGARVVIAEKKSASDGNALLAMIEKYKISVMQATPVTWKLLLDSGWERTPHLKVLCGGEEMTRDLADRLLKTQSQVWNMFGPTETTVWSSIGRVIEGTEAPDIGQPIDNTWFVILDKDNRPLPDGLYGELAIGGDGLAKGYLNRRELTEERFIEIDRIGRVYKTGDLARKRHDGKFEYCGRIDFQVKINGFRIELGEIESVLKEHNGINDAIVTVFEDENKDRSLVAYLIFDKEKKVESEQLRLFCQEKLPHYMVPRFFLQLEQFPLTSNGKIDRKSLPSPQYVSVENSRVFQPPVTEAEKKLVILWQQLLGKECISITDNYFELGGTSILATRLFSKIEKTFGVSLPLATLFKASTPQLLASVIDKSESKSADWELIVPIRSTGKKKPLFLIHGGGGNVLLYRELANHLPGDQPVYGIQAQGLDGKNNVLTSIEDMAAKYAKEIIAIDPEGPYYLGGYCMGGTIAYEMACQMRRLNKTVALVALLDTNREWVMFTRKQKFSYLMANIAFHWKNICQASMNGKYLFLKERSSEALRRFHRKYQVTISQILFKLNLKSERPLIIMEKINDAAAMNYRVKPYDGRITLFTSKALSDKFDPYLGWKKAETGGVDLVQLSAYRNGILISPFVKELADQLSKKLQQT